MGREERGRELGRREKWARCQNRGRRKLGNVHLVCWRSRRTLH